MKKILSLAAVAAATLTLTACHPPHEQPSDKKVETASEVAAPTAKVTSSAEAEADAKAVGRPKYVNCAGNPVNIPTRMNLDCSGNTKHLEDIAWSLLSQSEARGTGTLVEGDTTTPGVTVELSDPEETSQGLVFNSVTVNGKQIGAN